MWAALIEWLRSWRGGKRDDFRAVVEAMQVMLENARETERRLDEWRREAEDRYVSLNQQYLSCIEDHRECRVHVASLEIRIGKLENELHGQTPDRPAHVLLVDDDKDLCKLLQRQIALHTGGTSVAASTLKEGFDLLQDFGNAFDVAVVDIHLGDGSGIDLVKWAAAHRPRLPLLVLTGMEIGPHADVIRRCGAAFIGKEDLVDGIWTFIQAALRLPPPPPEAPA